MNKKFAWVAAIAWILAAMTGPVWAGTTPLVVLPQGNFSCEVEVKSHDQPGPEVVVSSERSAAVLKKISITRTGKIRRDVMFWSDGSSTEMWILADRDVALLEGRDPGKTIMLLRGDYREGVTPKLLDLNEESVKWITEGAAQGPAREDGAALHYKAQVTLREMAGSGPAVTATYQAWLDPKTKMPVKLDDGSALYLLKFSTVPPEGSLALPPKFKEELDLWLASLVPAKHR